MTTTDTASMSDADLQRHLAHYRTMLRRLNAVLAQLEARKHDSMAQLWAAELRAAIMGRAYLYRCPVHGDRMTLSQRHERGVRCGKAFRNRLGTCSETADLVGEVEVDVP